VTAVLRPQQARIRGQLVAYRTDSGQEAQNRRFSFHPILYNFCLLLRDTTTTATTTTVLLPITTEDTTTTTAASTKVVFAFRAKNSGKYHFEN
jgi:hypothetical protein